LVDSSSQREINVPWRDWIPGVLSKPQILNLCEGGYLTKAGDKPAVDYSSIDLHLTDEGYVLEGGSVKPSGRDYLHFIEKNKLGTELQPVDGVFLLNRRSTYLFKVRERLSSALAEAGVHGQATAKSSIGRLDVLARLVVDGAYGYEGFNPEELRQSNGEMFLEITPMTFPIRLRKGASLSQLRLFYGEPRICELRGRELWNTVLHDPDTDRDRQDALSVDLSDVTIGDLSVAAFEVSDTAGESECIDLWNKSDVPDPCKFWRFRSADKHNRLRIMQGSFYILRSRERLRLPAGLAAYCRALDETIGEMRIHYAGFVHPFFGWSRPDAKKGTPLIFEVRGHDLNVSLVHREKLARLTFYRMSADAKEEEGESTPYNKQELELSKYFGKWPSTLQSNEDGRVSPRPADNEHQSIS
jgi:dCTP deaminase